MRLFLFICFLLFFTSLYSQSGTAYYKLYRTFNEETPKPLNDVFYKLEFNSHSYRFELDKKLQLNNRDQLYAQVASLGVFYRNFKTNEKYNKLEFSGKVFVKKDTLYDNHWSLKNESL